MKRVLNDHYGTFGYIVSYSGAKKLLANVYPLPNNRFVHNFSYKAHSRHHKQRRYDGLDVYMFFPHLVYELKSLHKSTVQQYL